MSSLSTELARRYADFERLPHGTLDGETLTALEGRRVVVAGASGFVGSWVLAALAWLNRLAARPIQVTGISRAAMTLGESWFTGVAVDVRSSPRPPEADYAIHAAMSSEAAPAGGDTGLRDTARAGSRWVVAIAQQGARALALSSGAVEGSGDTYAEAKREMERDVTDAATSGAPIAIARLYTCMGPGYRAHAHLAHVSLFDEAKRGGPLTLRGDGSAVRSYLYGADVAAWLLRALVLAEPGEIVSVGSPEAVSVLDFAKRVARAAGLAASAVRTGTAPNVSRARYVPVPGNAHRRMGLAVWTTLDVAIARTLELWPGADA